MQTFSYLLFKNGDLYVPNVAHLVANVAELSERLQELGIGDEEIRNV